MIDPKKFTKILIENDITFFTGVPDSHLNGFCQHIEEPDSLGENVIAANEGNAVAIAAGYHLATGKIPLVYMQNSGLGNVVNPLASLNDKAVYDIPAILLIGWRGEPGVKDHDQHKLQGEITTKLLDIMEIPYKVLEDDELMMIDIVKWAAEETKISGRSAAIIVKKGVFTGDKSNIVGTEYPMIREDAIRTIIDNMPDDTIYIATTGRATRELYILREEAEQSHKCDFLNVGAMGHASSIALGIALASKGRKVVCLDGDASALMHMGAFVIGPKTHASNLIHVVLNNGVHESVGGQNSGGHDIDFTTIASGAGYETAGKPISDAEELAETIKELSKRDRAAFIDVRISKGMREDLGPLKASLKECKKQLMEELKNR